MASPPTTYRYYRSRAEARALSYGMARNRYSELMALAHMGYAPPSAAHGSCDPAKIELQRFRWRQDLTKIAGLAELLGVYGDGDYVWSPLTANAVQRLYNLVFNVAGQATRGPVDVQVIGIKEIEADNRINRCYR